jgi:hypothetical protein
MSLPDENQVGKFYVPYEFLSIFVLGLATALLQPSSAMTEVDSYPPVASLATNRYAAQFQQQQRPPPGQQPFPQQQQLVSPIIPPGSFFNAPPLTSFHHCAAPVIVSPSMAFQSAALPFYAIKQENVDDASKKASLGTLAQPSGSNNPLEAAGRRKGGSIRATESCYESLSSEEESDQDTKKPAPKKISRTGTTS